MKRSESRDIALLTFPGAQILDVTGPLEVFASASHQLALEGGRPEPAYRIEVLAADAGPLATSSGLEIVAHRSTRSVRRPLDTLIVGGGLGTQAAIEDGRLVRWIARHGPRARRLASVCTGTFLLAEAGMLDGRRATTHWAACARLAERYPKIRVESDPIFVRDGRLYSSAGVCAGMDLALALVEEDWGRELALSVAQRLVLFLKRPGGQSQFSAQLASQLADREPLRELQSWIQEHPAADLSVEALARRSGMSPRNFARVFAKEVGVTPARFVEGVRVEAARRQLEESTRPVDAVAAAVGFASPETMRRAFHRSLHVSPADYRHRFRGTSDARG